MHIEVHNNQKSTVDARSYATTTTSTSMNCLM